HRRRHHSLVHRGVRESEEEGRFRGVRNEIHLFPVYRRQIRGLLSRAGWMERDFLGAIGHEQLQQQQQQQQQRQRAAAEDDATRKESAYFGGGGVPPMDWSFAGRAGAAPAVMSFRSAPREEQQGELAYPKQQASRVLTSQRSFGAESHGSVQYAAAARAAYGGQPPQQQHAPNGARVIPMSSPFNPNNPMFRVQSSPNLPNGVAAGSPFKQPPFAMNNAVAASTVGVYKSRDMPKPKTAQLTIFYAGSVNVFNNVSAEKVQFLPIGNTFS
uniref:Tify domain-containing protein n=1 Tax=Aegilops tauschii subsp. strangulata TaxID=200361 RepID=A0A453KSK5_AEGTS